MALFITLTEAESENDGATIAINMDMVFTMARSVRGGTLLSTCVYHEARSMYVHESLEEIDGLMRAARYPS